MINKGLLIILDGYGEGESSPFNAVKNSKTPTLNALKNAQYSLIKTDGEAVGLFDGEMGGSEVGHTTIGAGRVVPSMAKQIHLDIENKLFEKNAVLKEQLLDLKNNKANLHLVGLMSDKNIHSDIAHAVEIIKIAKNKAKNIFVHFITDGRDSGCYDSLKYLEFLQNGIKEVKNCEIASVMGRFYAMDRENNLDRTNLAFDTMFLVNGSIKQNEIKKYLKAQHDEGILDEDIKPIHVITKENCAINENDCVLFFNFREDRLRQIVKKTETLNCKVITMADVGGTNATSMYPSRIVEHTLSEYLSEYDLKQIKIGESTKYAHVTYFLNGGKEQPFSKEDRVHVPTIKVDNFSKTPKMRAKDIAKETINAIKKNYDAVIVNFSNPDMVGHTGDYVATVKALEFLDKCLNKILKVVKKKGYFAIITADHGNAEKMKAEDGTPHTAHTLNPVFCSVVGNFKFKIKKKGELKDIAPTFVKLLGLPKNKFFEGNSLVTIDK